MNPHFHSPFPLFSYFAQNYPKQSCLVVLSLILGAFAETLGISALLPLISTLIDSGEEKSGALQNGVQYTFNLIGVEPTLNVLLTIIVVMITAKSVIVYLTLRYTGFVAADIARAFQLKLIRALMGAQWQYFSSLSIGVVSNAIAAESQRAGHSYMLAGRAIASFIQAAIYIGIAFLISWQLSLIAMMVGGSLVFFVKGLLKAARSSGEELSRTMDSLLSQLNNSINGAKPLKAMAQEDRFYDALDKQTGEVVVSRKKQYQLNLLLQMIYEPVVIVFLAVGLYVVITYSALPVSQILLLAFLFQRLMSYVSQTQSHYQNMVLNENAVWSMLSQTEDAEKIKETHTGGLAPTFNHVINVRNITVSYNAGPAILKGFSCEIPARKFTILSGPSGSGKTTLTDCILGLLPIESGSITIDGVELDDINVQQWRGMCGYVPQDVFLFHDTVRNNITLGDLSYSDADVIMALDQARAGEFVASLPNGINTVVGERGGKLSGGQRQRIVLARALIRKPKILILDEPTSALDKENEAAILSLLKRLSHDMAVVLITHNKDAIHVADTGIEML